MLQLLAGDPERRVRTVDGTGVFVDVSGFTELSERLARRGGREGAEQLADSIGLCFERLLAVAYDKGGGLLKFGGDALLLLFDGDAHTERACASAVAMRDELRAHGAVQTGTATVRLRMSVGVHSADYLLFAVGGSHRELLIAGPAATEVVRMENAARTGEVVVSAATAARLPERWLGRPRGSGRLLRSPPRVIRRVPETGASGIDDRVAQLALSSELRAHVLAGPQPPEHRIVTVAFLRFEDVDALVAHRGPDGAAAVLHTLLELVQDAADAERVWFLGSDIDADGGKLILTAGAPRALGDVVALAAERSGGSPQFLRDLLRAAASGSTELPDSVESAALARLDRLAPVDRTLIRRASVLGVRFHPRHLDGLLGDDVPMPDARTWTRLSVYFADDEDGYLRFRRQVVHDVAYAGLPFRVRRELHAAAGRRLERELGPDADDEAVRLSVHFHHARAYAKAWRYALLAADRARRQSAFADAATLYLRALDAARQFEQPPEEAATVWESLADAYVRTGELERADHALAVARRLASGDALRTAQLLWLHARIAERSGHVVRAVRWSNRALRALDGVEHERAAACRSQVVATLAAVRQRQGCTAEAVELAQRAIADAEAAGEELALGHACQILDWALVRSGRAGEAHHSARALEIFRRHGAADRESAVLNNMGGFAYLAGHWDEAVSLYREGGDASRRAGDVNFGAFADIPPWTVIGTLSERAAGVNRDHSGDARSCHVAPHR